MDTTFSPAENLVIDAAGRIDQDIACIKCGYNLRGLDPNHICPECATPVGRSTCGDMLQFSDPDWVEKLARGMKWVAAGIVVGIVGAILFSGGMIAMGTPPQMSSPLTALLMMIPGLVGVIGMWMVTTPEPRRCLSESPTSVRAIARIATVIAFCYYPLNHLLIALAPPLFVPFSLFGTAIGMVDIVAKLTYGRQLALRIPDQKLARNSRIVMWGMLAAMCLSILMTLPMLLMRQTAVTTAPQGGAVVGLGLISILGCFIAPVSLFFSLWAIRLVDQFRKALRASAQLARETWSRNLP